MSDMWPTQISSCHKAQVSYKNGKIICLECGEFCSAFSETNATCQQCGGNGIDCCDPSDYEREL